MKKLCDAVKINAMMVVDNKTPPTANVAICLISCFRLFQLVCNEPAKSKNPNKTSRIIFSICANSI